MHRLRRIGRYVGYMLWTNILYGLLVYWTFTWLAGYSMLYATLGNLALIVLGLVIDEAALRLLVSPKLVAELQAEKTGQQAHRQVQWILESFISFKSILYLFYVVILILSQALEYAPTLLNAHLRAFISANNSSILFLVAVDALIGQFSRDRSRITRTAQQLKDMLAQARQEG